MMIRVADYIAETLVRHGIRNLFLITGGGAMHLNDAFGRREDLRKVFCHHEQACTMAADSHFRLTGELAAVNVTTGPGGTNAITGVHGAWTDSLGMIVISGQVRKDTLACRTGTPLRQLGDQEIDIIRMVESITKYAVLVEEPESIRYHLEKAIHLAKSGRPGPVWLDVPMDVQGARVDPETLSGFTPEADARCLQGAALDAVCAEILQRLRRAQRPVILAGGGVRIAQGVPEFLNLVEKLGIPVTTGFNAHDLLPHGHPLLCGRPGTIGDRAGNFTVQNADLVLVLGCRLNIRQVSYNWASFARAAFKIQVDIDRWELEKPTVRPDLPVHADLRAFLAAMAAAADPAPPPAHRAYLAWCKERVAAYPVVLPDYWAKSSPVNPYCFAEVLFDTLGEGEIVVTGNATACIVPFQAARLKAGQRLYSNSGSASMGYDLPAAIGAAVAANAPRVVCLAGDGSLQMNVQELATIAHNRLPIKVFVLNNQGYHSIRQTQTAHFPDNLMGIGPSTGVGFPDLGTLARAYGLPFHRIETHDGMPGIIREVLDADGPGVCEVILDPEQPFSPKLASRRLEDGRMVSPALEDLAPFLSREELQRNLLIPPT